MFADLDVAGRFAQVFYDNPTGSTVGVPPSSSILAGAMAIDTAQRYQGYQLTTNALIEQDDHDFQAYNFQQSAFIRIFPSFRLIGRGGYDSVEQPGIVNIREAMWSAGGEYNFGVNPGFPDSTVSVEYGERFGHSAWRGDLYLQISDRFYAQGRYFESIQPNQLQINTAFTSFALATVQLPTALSSSQFQINGNIDNQTALNKQAEVVLVYTWPDQSLALRGTWNDRMLLALNNAHDRSLVTGIDYLRSIAPDLAFAAGIDYYHTFENPFFGANENYGGNVGLQYDLNSTMRAAAGYAYQRQVQLFNNGQSHHGKRALCRDHQEILTSRHHGAGTGHIFHRQRPLRRCGRLLSGPGVGKGLHAPQLGQLSFARGAAIPAPFSTSSPPPR